jgi:hypothetical protein
MLIMIYHDIHQTSTDNEISEVFFFAAAPQKTHLLRAECGKMRKII